jgi:hypothetical protein
LTVPSVGYLLARHPEQKELYVDLYKRKG